jgi:fumarate hydratase class II
MGGENKMKTPSRIERDTMGEVSVPGEALYGAETQRAVENFPISRLRFTRPFIRALGIIKAAAAKANGERGVLPRDLAVAIETAAQQLAQGDYDAQFVVDIFQTGSGTSANMNANEVIGRLAGAHPKDHVNLSQSSNDVIPTAIHVAAAELVHHELLPAMARLHSTLREKAEEFGDVLKIGRTHLQDAVPIRLGRDTFDSCSGRSERDTTDRHRPHIPQLCKMELHGLHIDVIVRAWNIRKPRKNPATRHVPVSGRKWRSRVWPGPQESRN